jgi:hypothetical protein
MTYLKTVSRHPSAETEDNYGILHLVNKQPDRTGVHFRYKSATLQLWCLAMCSVQIMWHLAVTAYERKWSDLRRPSNNKKLARQNVDSGVFQM